ncbi:MAG: 50S ribosomal protein L1 [Patescibacteria group bacterium]
MNRSKRYRAVGEGMEPKKTYAIAEAIGLVKKGATAKFDESIEVHLHLGIDPKKADQQIRSTTVLPNPTGRTLRIAVFANEADQKKALAAGAALAGGAELIKEIKTTGKTDFDLALATPEMMRQLGPVAKILGTKGLMPNPKNETVTTDVVKTLKDLQGGKIAFRSDDTGNIHQIIGKASFEPSVLEANIRAFVEAIKRAKPDASKGVFIRSITLTSTMGPGLRINL